MVYVPYGVDTSLFGHKEVFIIQMMWDENESATCAFDFHGKTTNMY